MNPALQRSSPLGLQRSSTAALPHMEMVPRKLFLFFLLAGLLLAAPRAEACSCSQEGPFVEMVKKSGLVVRAKVKSYGPKLSFGEDRYENMTVEISEVLKGEYNLPTLVILGDPGYLCRPYITPAQFKKGSEYLFALPEPLKNPQELSICGEYWIRIEGETARGETFEKELTENQVTSTAGASVT